MSKAESRKKSYWNSGIYLAIPAILIVAGIILYSIRYRDVIQDEMMHLETISSYKTALVESWISERKADANALTSNLALISAINQYLANSSSKDYNYITSRFDAYIKEKHYKALFLLDLNGKIVHESPVKIEVLMENTKKEALQCLSGDKAMLGSIVYCGHHQELHWDVYVPIFRDYVHKSDPIAIMIFRTNADDFINNNIISFPAHSQTTESLIIEVAGDSINVLTPTRYHPDASKRLRVPLLKEKTALHHAIQGKSKADYSVDYRGEKVLGIVMPIAKPNWYLVTKIDLDEALKPVWVEMQKLLLLGFFILAFLYSLLYIIHNNIKRRRLAEKYQEQLDRQALTRHYEHIVRYANDVIYLCDENNRIIEFNDSALAFYGYSREELENLDAAKLIEPELYAKHKQIYRLEDYLKGLIIETLHVKKDGTIKPVEASIRAIEIEKDIYYQCIIRDISERKAAEKAQKELHKQIRDLNNALEHKVNERTEQVQNAYQELESFSYSVSHDLRAPLRSIRGFGEALAEDEKNSLSVTGKDHLQRIITACITMQNLIESLLELSRVSRAIVNPMPVDISKMIEDIFTGLQEEYPERQMSLQILPNITVRADGYLIKIALQNILNNALKFCSKNVETKINIGYEEEEGKKKISITDNGVGFDMRYVDRLFIPFQRLHSEAEFPGSGIGLSIVKRVMQKHEGNVSIHSVNEEGTTVIIEFVEDSIENEDSIT